MEGVRASIQGACKRAGRDHQGVTLVAVSKYATLEEVLELAGAGQRAFGENRMQEAVPKVSGARAAGREVEWHMVGHLQTNKVGLALDHFDVIQSVDSRHLAGAISRRAVFYERTVPLLLQVNVAADRSKYGFSRDDVVRDYPDIARLPGLEVLGLMTIGPLVEGAEQSRPHFAALRELRDQLDGTGVAGRLAELSMGMSADFEVAIEEGATIIRVGSALFGAKSV